MLLQFDHPWDEVGPKLLHRPHMSECKVPMPIEEKEHKQQQQTVHLDLGRNDNERKTKKVLVWLKGHQKPDEVVIELLEEETNKPIIGMNIYKEKDVDGNVNDYGKIGFVKVSLQKEKSKKKSSKCIKGSGRQMVL